MEAYIDQLNRMYPEVARYKGMRFKKHWQQHDFGTYGEVVITYNDEEEEEETLALKVEWNLPSNWDEIAKEKISEKTNKGN
jgi:biotin-(acetyl-CoA carboxylase) ligase